MNIHYHIEPGGNFGDDLNSWIWDFILPGWKNWDCHVTLLGVGTLIQNGRLSEFLRSKLLICGSGVGYGPIPSKPLPLEWDIRCVRGPRSAAALGLSPEYSALDPAALIPDFFDVGNEEKSKNPIFIPHCHDSSTRRHEWDTACKSVGLEFVSPRVDAREVIKKIARAPLVIAESMHAAIIADAFRVPWVPVRISRLFYLDKWLDWGDSLNLKFDIPPLFSEVDFIDRNIPILRYRKFRYRARRESERWVLEKNLQRALRKYPRYLSEPSILCERKSKLKYILSEIIHDYGR